MDFNLKVGTSFDKTDNIVICTEDSTSGFDFWNYINDNVFDSKLDIRRCGKHSNNAKLLKFVKSIKLDDKIYYIAFDNLFDNPAVVKLFYELINYVRQENLSNVVILDLVCFEYFILKFSKLIDWCFKEGCELKNKRIDLIKCRDEFIDPSKSIYDYKNGEGVNRFINEHNCNNIEQFCSKLLSSLTRNTGFHITKGHLDECWINDCCLVNEDIVFECGLEFCKLSCKEKALALWSEMELNAMKI